MQALLEAADFASEEGYKQHARFARCLAEPCSISIGSRVTAFPQNRTGTQRRFRCEHPYLIHSHIRSRPAIRPDGTDPRPWPHNLFDVSAGLTSEVRNAQLTFALNMTQWYSCKL